MVMLHVKNKIKGDRRKHQLKVKLKYIANSDGASLYNHWDLSINKPKAKASKNAEEKKTTEEQSTKSKGKP